MAVARWTVDQVLALAPDDSSRKAAKGLTSPRTWSELGSTETLVWGKCQGSGKDPYQVSVDLHGPAFRCSCPSRKFPCKHGAALLLMWAANDGTVGDTSNAAAFADEWARERQSKEEGKQEKAVRRAERAMTGDDDDREARTKRESLRAANIDAGVLECQQWINDLVRQGAANARTKPYSYWDQAAARLVDAQAPALAERIRALGGAIVRRDDWIDHLLRELARITVITTAWIRRAHLDEVALADLRAALGWARSTDEIRAGVVADDRWVVHGARQDGNERIASQRTWLWGEQSRRWVVLLDFAVGGGSFGVAHVNGAELDGSIALYPGGAPQRALVVDAAVTGSRSVMPSAMPVADALAAVTAVFGANPFATRAPVALDGVRVVKGEQRWLAVDGCGHGVPLAFTTGPWELLAHVGDGRCQLFGEWEHGALHVLTVAAVGGEAEAEGIRSV